MVDRFYISGIVMVLASILSLLLKPNVKMSDLQSQVDLEDLVPIQFSDWRIDKNIIPVLPSPEVQSKLDLIYSQTLTRTYVNKVEQRIMLSIAYGGVQRDGLRVHRPEVCYTSQGFSVTNKNNRKLDIDENISIPVIQMNAASGSRHEPITYWVTIGKKIINNKIGRKMEQIRYGLKGTIPDAYLVRVSSLGKNNNLEFMTHKLFIKDMLSELDDRARARLFGEIEK